MIGDVIAFGCYPQEESFPTPLEWYIIKESQNKLMLLSKRVIGRYPFIGTWEESELRHFLNHGFYDIAFSESEKARIVETICLNDTGVEFDNSYIGDNVDCGKVSWATKSVPIFRNPTRDKVFLLELRDIIKNYTLGQGIYDYYTNNDYGNIYLPRQIMNAGFAKEDECLWWIRSEVNYPYCVSFQDEIPKHVCIEEATPYRSYTATWFQQPDRTDLTYSCGVRPAIWINGN